MAGSTPEEQFSLISQQLLLLNQLPQQDDALASLEAAPPKLHTSFEKTQISLAAISRSAGVKSPIGPTSADSSGPVVNIPSTDSQAYTSGKPDLQDAANAKSHRLQQMQMALIEHQNQLLRQREQLQQQQRLLLQRSQERNVAPSSLAQLFADLHEARQQQYLQTQQTQQRTDPSAPVHTSDGRAQRTGWRHHCSKLPGSGAGVQHLMPHCMADGVAGVAAKRGGKPPGGQAEEGHPDLEPFQAEEARRKHHKGGPSGHCSADRRRILLEAGLLNADSVLSCTLNALRLSRRNASAAHPQDSKDNSTSEGSSRKAMESPSDIGSLRGLRTLSQKTEPSAPTTASWGGRYLSHGPTGGKAMQVHGEPLPLPVLCGGVSPGKLWRHCLRVTLHARRCSIRTRRYWKALVHLFPRRSAYSTMTVLSEEDLKKYNSIGPRGSSSVDAAAAVGSWVAPKEPFCEPGLYCLMDERGPIIAAWAVARDSDGRLRRCAAMVGSAAIDAADEAVVKRKRAKPTAKASKPEFAWGSFLRENEHVEAEGLQALEKWYVNVANEPLTEQHIRSLTLAEYTSIFGEYAEGLVSALQRLVETRHAASYTSKGAEGCGCSCSICVGHSYRVRLAWRQHLMAFELAIDKKATPRSHSDSSGEDSGGAGSQGTGRDRPVAALRSHKGRWEWCRKCPLGCRMHLQLILHELYQPLSLTKPGMRSALAQLLMRLRRYVILSPLGVEFLLERLKQIRLTPASGAGVQDVFSQAREWDEDELYCSWATRDWAQASWHRRQQRCQADVPNTLIGSNDLDSSIVRLSMLSATLDDAPACSAGGLTGPGLSADGSEPEARRPLPKPDISAEQLQALAEGVARQDCPGMLGGEGIHTLRMSGLPDAMANADDEEEGSRSPQYSYPISIASSQRSDHSHQRSDGAVGYASFGPSDECGLSAHSDGTGRISRGGVGERDDLGRPGHGDGLRCADGLDTSPRRLRRMQRARMASEDQQAATGRRRVTPLAPWWWEDYVKTGVKQGAQRSESGGRGANDAASDSSSSVDSTISLAASPHVFRIPCGSAVGEQYSSAEPFPGQTSVTRTGAMLARFTEAVDSQSRSGLQIGTHHAGDGTSIDLIHAAADLVDSIESWPVEFEAQGGAATKAHQNRGRAPGERTDGAPSECALPPTSEAPALPACAPAGRRAKSPRGSEGNVSTAVQPSTTQSMMTFVSAVLATPTDNEVDSLNGFELLQGALRALFGTTSPVESPQMEAVEIGSSESAFERTAATQQGAELTANRDVSVVRTPARDADVAEEGRECVAKARSESAQPSDTAHLDPLDMSATTPLLRSLAASSAPPVEDTQGQLAVDDFYALPLPKDVLCYRDAYEPFEDDYADVQIRLKPMRAFGRRQDRHSRHRRRSWRPSSQSAGSSPRGTSPVPSRPQGTTGVGLRKPIQGGARGGSYAPLTERTGTVRIGGRRVVVRTLDDGASLASREPSAGGLSDFSLSRCSMSVDSSISSRGVSVCSRATSNAGSVSDASIQGGGTPQSPTAHEGAPRHKRGRSRPPPGGRGGGGGGNSSTPTGVYLDVARKLWRCQWRENGRFKTKSFPLNQYKTLKEARRACVMFRCLMGGWDVQPAWLGDDEGGDINVEQSEGYSEPSGKGAGTEEAKSTAAAP
ncbi:hypothetical protein, conserved [Eimeria brunetti]|uniref:AP2/ERF domain-containing protein n=1 Tax=Eimeria brunetti TaxID=51314 RepID=U6LGI1_9EIME|nr:hypothetical protein, conserved [Eimeria brunetti]